MVELKGTSGCAFAVFLDDQKIADNINGKFDVSLAIEVMPGEHELKLTTADISLEHVKIHLQTLDRKKAIVSDNTIFLFDAIDKHANFSKHHGKFGHVMLRKDRVKL